MTWTNVRDSELRRRAEAVIPNGMYGHQSVFMLPEGFPQFFARADGAYLWDADGNRYVDFMCGYGPQLLGYGHPEIDAAYVAQMKAGDTMTGPSPHMVELAETFVSMVGHADWAMFCKNGTDATSMALMIARQQTERKTVLLAKGAYHGAAAWCTPLKPGVIPEDRAHQIHYEYNNVESLEAAAAQAGDDLAAIFGSPFKHDTFVDQEALDPAYARKAREIADRTGALLVVDDVRAGFRMARDCSWSLAGVQPDLSTWGKAIANGHPISALLGVDKARMAAMMVYVTGSFWFSAAPMAASLVTLRLLRETDYLEKTVRLGGLLREGLAEAAAKHGFALRQTGPVQMPLIMIEEDHDLGLGYAWTTELLKRGVYFHPWHNLFMSAAMTEDDIAMTVKAADQAFAAVNGYRSTIEPITKLQLMASLLA